MYKAVSYLAILFYFSAGYAQTDSLTLDYDKSKRLASLPLACIETIYPNKLNQVLTDSTFLDSPQNLHPVFYGCFDWHSSVHGHWMLAVILNKFPDSELGLEIVSLFDKQFTAEKIMAELRYFEPKLEKSFERTYGWAWLLKLYEELYKSPLNESHGWTKNLQPLADFIVDSYKKFLPKLVYPIRVGEHTNTAFGLSLALDYANTVGDGSLRDAIWMKSLEFYANDCDCPINYEPGGFDFLSPCLQEAELMSKILFGDEYKRWLKKFLPQVLKKNFVLEPARVIDRTDGKLVHLDGLNFSRAWCLYAIGFALPEYAARLNELGDQHMLFSMGEVIGSHYMGSHWLASFLVYALEERNAFWVVEIAN